MATTRPCYREQSGRVLYGLSRSIRLVAAAVRDCIEVNITPVANLSSIPALAQDLLSKKYIAFPFTRFMFL
jgi:hypothetical protein